MATQLQHETTTEEKIAQLRELFAGENLGKLILAVSDLT